MHTQLLCRIHTKIAIKNIGKSEDEQQVEKDSQFRESELKLFAAFFLAISVHNY